MFGLTECKQRIEECDKHVRTYTGLQVGIGKGRSKLSTIHQLIVKAVLSH